MKTSRQQAAASAHIHLPSAPSGVSIGTSIMPPSSSTHTSCTGNNSSTLPTISSKQQQQQQPISLKVLRVADQELSSGNKSGAVFLQLSKGAVAWPMERPVAQARVQRHIQALIDADEIAFSKPK